MKVEETEVDLLLELAHEKATCDRLRIYLEAARREKQEQLVSAGMAQKKLSQENVELRAGLRQANELIATNLGMAHKLAEALAKTTAALEEAHQDIKFLSTLIEYKKAEK